MSTLARRNTVHPLQHRSSMRSNYTPASTNSTTRLMVTTTNPFLNSVDDHTPSPFLLKTRPFQQSSPNTTPFAYTTTTNSWNENSTSDYVPSSSPTSDVDPRKKSRHRHASSFSHSSTTNFTKDTHFSRDPGTTGKPTSSKDLRSRRMSLDIIKSPFGWNRHRRPTCAITTSQKHISLSQGDSRYFPTVGSNDEGGYEEIQRTAIYRDSELGRDDNKPNESTVVVSRTNSVQGTQHVRTHSVSYNPFLQEDSGPTIQGYQPSVQQWGTNQDWEDSSSGHQQEEKEAEVVIKILPRRRHSVFSDWSVEDCPRLLAAHKTEEHQQHQEEMYNSRTSLTRSMTMKNYPVEYQPQHRRHSSVAHHPPPASGCRARRNTVTLATNSTVHESHYQQRMPHSRSSIKESDPLNRYQDRQALDHEDHDVQDNSAITARNDYDHDNSNNIHPLDLERPSTVKLTPTLHRQDSRSYAQDFGRPNNNSTIHRPPIRPWVYTGRSSSLKSFGSPTTTSPLHQSSSIYDHDIDDQNIAISRVVSVQSKVSSPISYRDVQLRPYGQEFEDEEQDKDDVGDYAQTETEQDQNAQRDKNERFVSTICRDEEDDQAYYNALARQLTRHPYDDDEGDTLGNGVGISSGYNLSDRKNSLFGTSDQSLTKGFQASFYKLMSQSHEYYDDDHFNDADQRQNVSRSRSFRSRLTATAALATGGVSTSTFSLAESAQSFTSSFRARVERLTKTNTVFRQVKRRISMAARNVMTEANKAAQKGGEVVGPFLSLNRSKSTKKASVDRFSGSIRRRRRRRSSLMRQEQEEEEEEEEQHERSQFHDPEDFLPGEEDAPYISKSTDEKYFAGHLSSEAGPDYERDYEHIQEHGPITMSNRQGGSYPYAHAVSTR
ncbi:hypothetical protein BGZ83_004361 [Gryganskiella cystojenkinii]|nr:hypothetical protein BGZ83_004361 [Gryganskiella cystojenkinii]